jgi:uncharacterized protein DUF3667
MPKKFLKSDICSNCKTDIGDANYCPNCGQINSHKQISLKQILKDLLGDYFTFDNKFFQSLWPLVGKPGHLTNEYISGKRNTYILPLRLYIFTTFLFFLVLSLISAVDPYQLEEQQKHEVTPDSLRQFFKVYEDELPNYFREILILDISDQYKLEKKEYRKRDKDSEDSIKKILLIAQPGLADSMAALYARQLSRKISFLKIENQKNARKKLSKALENPYIPKSVIGTALVSVKKIKSRDRALLKKLLADYQFSESEINVLIAEIESTFTYRKAKLEIENIDVKIMGQDTASVAFIRKLEKKAEFIFAQGNRGFAIFWNELIRQIPKIMFLVLPLFALLLKLFYVRQKIFYINHLIFSLHVHSLLFMYLIIAIVWPNGWIIGGSILAIWVHTFIAFKNVYRQKTMITFFKLNSILLLYFFINIFAFILLSILAVWAA